MTDLQRMPIKILPIQKWGDFPFWIALIIISLLGMAALGYCTRFGLGLVNDSAAYVNGAENLQLGNGYTRTSGDGELKPITHFPPFFSILLAFITKTGDSFLNTAHRLVIFLFGLDIFLVGLIVLEISQSKLYSSLAAFTFALSETFLGVYAYLLSEPLFITLMLLAFILFYKYLKSTRNTWLFITGFVLGLAYLTRFSAVSLFFTSVVILLCVHRAVKQTVSSILVLLAGALPFVFGLSIISTAQSTEFGNRQILVHLIPPEDLFEALKNLLSWTALDFFIESNRIFGWILSALALLLLPVLVSWVLYWIWNSKKDPQEPESTASFLAFLAAHICIYFTFLIISISFFDASTPLDDRILSILYIPTLVLFFYSLSFINQKLQTVHGKYRAIRILLVTISLLFVMFNSLDGLGAAEQLGRDGLGFNHTGWRQSQAIRYIQSIPNKTIYSNRPTAIYLLTGRSSFIVPTEIDPVTTDTRTTYAEDIKKMQADILSGRSILVFFIMPGDEDTIDWINDITRGLPTIKTFDQSIIYGLP